ncbi:MAG: DinB family protein [Gemmatimonadaceae bacterium]
MSTPPFVTFVHAILVRDLHALRREVEAYPDDASIWAVPDGIANSCGTLVLHLAGNLRTYVGLHLGGVAYVRDRPREFSARNLPRAELLRDIDATIAAVDEAMPKVSAAALAARFPMAIGAVTANTQDFLLHVAVHLGYHLGQVDYHRRLVTQSNTTVSTMAPGELASAERIASA